MTHKEITQLQVGDYVQYSGEMSRSRTETFPIWKIKDLIYQGGPRELWAVFVHRVVLGKLRPGWTYRTIQKLRLVNYCQLTEGEVLRHVVRGNTN